MTTIFHITGGAEWYAVADGDEYRHPSLEHEGFIHLSAAEQVVATTGRYYAGVEGLVLLEVDADVLDTERLVWESSTGGELFPHLYGPLPTSAVVAVHQWDEAAQQSFSPTGDASHS